MTSMTARRVATSVTQIHVIGNDSKNETFMQTDCVKQSLQEVLINSKFFLYDFVELQMYWSLFPLLNKKKNSQNVDFLAIAIFHVFFRFAWYKLVIDFFPRNSCVFLTTEMYFSQFWIFLWNIKFFMNFSSHNSDFISCYNLRIMRYKFWFSQNCKFISPSSDCVSQKCVYIMQLLHFN